MGSALTGPLRRSWVLTNWGKRYALALFGRHKQVNGSTQKVPLPKKHEIRSDPISADPVCPSPSSVCFLKHVPKNMPEGGLLVFGFRLTKPVGHPPSRGGVPPLCRWASLDCKKVSRWLRGLLGLVISLSLSLSLSIHIYIYMYIHVSLSEHRPGRRRETSCLGTARGYGQFSKLHVCFCGLDPGNLKFETVRTHKQHICF